MNASASHAPFRSDPLAPRSSAPDDWRWHPCLGDEPVKHPFGPDPPRRAWVVGLVALLTCAPVLHAGGGTEMHIPIKWSGIAGSPSIDNPGVVGEATVKDVLWRRHERISEFRLIPTCNVTLRSAAMGAVPDFPVIADPAAVGNPGDISLGPGPNYNDFDEFDDAIDATRTAWTGLGFSADFGLTAVSMNRFVDDTGAVIGVLGLGGWSPTTCDAAIQAIIGRAMVIDPGYLRAGTGIQVYSDEHETILGQELLHGLAMEDGSWGADPAHNPDPGNLMYPFFPNGGALTAAQCTRFRDQAIAHVPGVYIDPVPEPFADMRADRRRDVDLPLVDIHNTGIARATGLKQTHLFLDTKGCLGANESALLNYAFLIDTDNNRDTGGAPVAVGVPVDTRGIEVVGRLAVQGTSKELAWQFYRYRDNAFQLVPDPRIRGELHCHYVVVMFAERDLHHLAGQIAELIVPDDLLPDLGPQVRFITQARDVARQVTDTSDELQLTFKNPTFPVCTLTPQNILNGGTVRIQAQGLVPNQNAHILVGPDLAGTGTTDAAGNLDVTLALTLTPEPTAAGQHLITIGTDETAITADCLVNIAPRRPKPPLPGCDYENSEAILTLDGLSVPVSGPTIIQRGQPVRDRSGRIVVPLEMQAACLEGEAPGLGKVRVQIGERFGLKKTAGQIRGSQEALFPADSFFDVFAKIEMENAGAFCNEQAIRMGAQITSIPPCGTPYFAGTQTIVFRDCCTGETRTNVVHVQHQLTCGGPAASPPILEKRSCIQITGTATGAGRVGLNLVLGTDCAEVVVSSGDVVVAPGQSAATTAALLANALQAALRGRRGCDFEVTVSGSTLCITTRALSPIECCLTGTSLGGGPKGGGTLLMATLVNLGQGFIKSESATTFPDPRCRKDHLFLAKTFPPVGVYQVVDDTPLYFTPNILVRRFRHEILQLPPDIFRPPVCLSCPPDVFEFSSPIFFEILVGDDERAQWLPIQGVARSTVMVTARGRLGRLQTFDTELLALDIQADLPQGAVVRQSRERRSLGQTSLRPVPGKGGWMISSSLDVNLELAVGGTVLQAPGPVHLELTRDPLAGRESALQVNTFPPRGSYNALVDSTLDFGGGLITRRYRHPIWDIPIIIVREPPCLTCPPVDFPIEAPIHFELSTDYGKTFRLVSANAKMGVRVFAPRRVGSLEVYDAEVMQLDVAGGDLPAGAMLRLNPDVKSVGQTTLRRGTTGFMLSSTFDLCVQATPNGGQTWLSAAGASHLEFSTRPVTTITPELPNITLAWGPDVPGTTVLERAASPLGGWTPVPGATSPLRLEGPAGPAFYRLNRGGETSEVVGHYEIVPQPGFSMLANQISSGGNSIAEILPDPPDGTQVYKYDPDTGSFRTFIYDILDGAWLPNGDETLNPGEGAFVRFGNNPGNICLAGEVLEGDLEIELPAGFSIVSSPVAQAGTPADLGLPAEDGDQLYLFNPQTQQYEVYIYDVLDGNWLPQPPAIGVGQSFWIRKNTATTWTREFSANR